MMRDDFIALILTHGRADDVLTYRTLRTQGYTGRIALVVDDEDSAIDQYRRLYGDEVVVFNKAYVEGETDDGDNFDDNRAIVYARNISFEIARSLGARYFIQLDDDYYDFRWRIDGSFKWASIAVRRLDDLFSALVDYLAATPFLSVAIGQGGLLRHVLAVKREGRRSLHETRSDSPSRHLGPDGAEDNPRGL